MFDFFLATCMLEKKSLQQFKEEWLVKFPITYKVILYNFIMGYQKTSVS